MSDNKAVIAKAENQNVAIATKSQSFNDFIANESASTIQEIMMQDLSNKVAGVNTALQYLELEQGEPKRFVFMGIIPNYTCMSNDGVMIQLEAVVLVDEKKDFYAYAATQLVGTIADRGFAIGQGLEICWTKHKKTKGGNMRVHTVKPLQ